MKPSWLLLSPLVVQSAAMAFDELHFHRQRGLGRWERIGHPLDTLTVLACIGWVLTTRPGPPAVIAYLVLAVVSCLFITKDELVHARQCSAGEHWLHALLFLVHPVSLGVIGLLWPALHRLPGQSGAGLGLSNDAAPIARLLPVQFVLTGAFCFYQAAYWNLPWLRRAAHRL